MKKKNNFKSGIDATQNVRVAVIWDIWFMILVVRNSPYICLCILIFNKWLLIVGLAEICALQRYFELYVCLYVCVYVCSAVHIALQVSCRWCGWDHQTSLLHRHVSNNDNTHDSSLSSAIDVVNNDDDDNDDNDDNHWWLMLFDSMNVF